MLGSRLGDLALPQYGSECADWIRSAHVACLDADAGENALQRHERLCRLLCRTTRRGAIAEGRVVGLAKSASERELRAGRWRHRHTLDEQDKGNEWSLHLYRID